MNIRSSHFRFLGVLLLLSFVLVFGSRPVYALDAPDNIELLSFVQANLPGYVEAKNLKPSTPSHTTGSGGVERLIYRFETDMIVKGPLFGKLREEGPFAIVMQISGAGKKYHVSGALDLTSAGNHWSAGVSFESDLAKIGLPLENFAQPTLVQGDPATDLTLARLRSEVLANALQKAQAEIASKVDELRKKGLAEAEAERKRGATAVLDLIAQNAKQRGKIIARQKQELQELQDGLEAERERLKREVAAAGDIVKMQTDLSAQLKEIALADARAISTFTIMRKQRIRLLDALPKKWAGTVTCVDNNDTSLRSRSPITFEIKEIHSASLKAEFAHQARGYSSDGGVISIIGDSIQFPLKLAFSVPGFDRVSDEILPSAFTLELTSDGRLQGTQSKTVNWQGKQSPSTVTCTYNLSG